MRAKAGSFPGDRPCAHPGCKDPGEYRAPLSRPGSAFAPPSGPPQWQYFCLEHVRAFNAGWNWFEGLDADAIWQAQTPYPTWDRETRAFAHNLRQGASLDGIDRVEDALGVLRWKAAAARTKPTLGAADRRALAALGLGEDATLADIKAKYRALARRYHPDSNAGSRAHEARFQALTEAHDQLIRSAAFRK
jgi:hypothetical protein